MDPRSGGDVFVYYKNVDISHPWKGSRILLADDMILHCGHRIAWLYKLQVICKPTFAALALVNLLMPADYQKGGIGDNQYVVPSQRSIAFTLLRGWTYDPE
ncbi:hypothetical protein I7I51_00971 [Histoplasma capsulatum]|uniref:Uncharacterized protein n=1 Tax=Ajellomyces capsulatus TaxID=5037 RepID=A0A8A1MFH2_AJECA|nr:hypothetical protein I7I51_00971 [Histoplasma capsulatum]